MTLRRTLPVFAMAVLAGVSFDAAPAQVYKSGSGYLFRARYTKGQTAKYRLTTSVVTGAGKPLSFALPLTYRVVDVKNGVASVRFAIGPMNGADGKSQLIEAREVTVELDSRNRPIGDVESPGGLTAQFPARYVRVGETWTAAGSFGGTPGGAAANAKITYKFLGIRQVRGRTVAALGLTLKGVAAGTGTLNLRPGDGQIDSMDAKLSMGTSRQGTSIHMDMRRLGS